MWGQSSQLEINMWLFNTISTLFLKRAVFFRALFFFFWAFSVFKLLPCPKALHYLAVHLSSKDILNQATFPTSVSLQSDRVSPREKCQILHPFPPLNNDHFGWFFWGPLSGSEESFCPQRAISAMLRQTQAGLPCEEQLHHVDQSVLCRFSQ